MTANSLRSEKLSKFAEIRKMTANSLRSEKLSKIAEIRKMTANSLRSEKLQCSLDISKMQGLGKSFAYREFSLSESRSIIKMRCQASKSTNSHINSKLIRIFHH